MGCEAELDLARGHRAGADLPVPCQGQALDRPAPPRSRPRHLVAVSR